MEEYLIAPANDLTTPTSETNTEDKDQIRIYSSNHGQSWVAKPIGTGRSILLASRQESFVNQSLPKVDPLVTLFNSIHERLPENSGGSNIFTGGEQQHHHQIPTDQWDEENVEDTLHK